MFIEAVLVCVNFSDVLAHTLPLNKKHFDRMVVVTDEGDAATWTMCRHHHVECVTTNDFYRQDHAFNKGRGINAGLERLGRKDWLIQIDADIVLPPRFRELVEGVCQLEAENIYGIDRLMCPDFDAWIQYVAAPVCQHPDEIFVIPEPFRMGARVAKLGDDGFTPIGFFQMWNVASGIVDYPVEHGIGGRADMAHALRWPRHRRVLIPEIIGIHLEGPIAPGQKNWRGRVMGPFGPVAIAPGSNPQIYR
jgi:hypothetical protein